MPKAVISHKQFSAILFVYIFGASVLFIPEAMWAGKDAWLSTLIGSALGLVILAAWLRLARRHPGKSPIQIGVRVFGPVLGYPLGFYLVMIFFIVGTLIIQDLVILISTAVLRNTPPTLIRFSFVLVALYACYKGVESIGRLSELVFLPLIMLVVVVPIFEFPNLAFSALQPWWVIDWAGVATGTLNALVFPFAETVMVMMLYPYTTPDRNADKAYYLVFLGTGLLLVVRTLLGIMVFSPGVLQQLTLHFYTVFRQAALGEFFDRIEGVFLGMWLFGLLLKMIITLYVTGLGLAQLTGVRRLQNLWLPLAALMVLMSSQMYPDTMQFSWFSFKVLPFLALPGEIILPFVLLIADAIRRRLSPRPIDSPNQGGKELTDEGGGVQEGAIEGD